MAKHTFESMEAEFVAYCAEQGLPEVDAMELIFMQLTPEQRTWISDFINRWEDLEQEEDTIRSQK